MRWTRLALGALVALAIALFFVAGAQRYFTFDNLKLQQAAVEAWYAAHPA